MRRLIIRPGAIGDFIVSLPALECLRAGYTDVWTASPNVPLARFAEGARSIARVGLDRLGVLPAEDVVERLRAFDSIVSWYGANRPEFRDLTASLGLPFTFHAALPPEGVGMHASDFYLEQVGGRSGGIPRILCQSAKGDFAVIHPFAASARKRWPLDRFRDLARRLERRMPVYWCRGPEDELAGAISIPDLYELGCWIASARVFIGNDSGISHLAAAVGTPVVALFGPTDPTVWAPRGPSVTVIAKPAMEEIDVSEVDAAIE